MALAHAAATAGFIPVGDGSLALHYFALARKALDGAPDLLVESYLHMLLALHYGGRGAQNNAAIHADRAIVLAREAGGLRAHDECVAVRAGVELALGRHEGAAAYVSMLEASAKTRGDTQMLAWALLQKAACALLRGDAAASTPATAEVERLLPELARPEAIWFYSLSAYALACAGAYDEARCRADRAKGLIDAGPLVQSYLVDAFGRLTEARLACYRHTRARSDGKAAKKACDFLFGASKIFRWAAPVAHLHRGTLLDIAGKHAAAESTWRMGLALAATMDAPYDEARISLALVQCIHGKTSELERARLRVRATKLLSPLNIAGAQAYPMYMS
jgi:hypothetical protein